MTDLLFVAVAWRERGRSKLSGETTHDRLFLSPLVRLLFAPFQLPWCLPVPTDRGVLHRADCVFRPWQERFSGLLRRDHVHRRGDAWLEFHAAALRTPKRFVPLMVFVPVMLLEAL